jgi:hypothetical protein
MDNLSDETTEEQYVPKKSKLFIIVHSDIVSKGMDNVMEYVKSVMGPYCDDFDCDEPKLVNDPDKILNEYAEHSQLYDDFDEFCMKNYGAYFNEEGKLVSKLNDDTFWETYDVLETKEIKEIDDFINGEIRIIFDEHKNILYTKTTQFDYVLDMVKRNLTNYIVLVEYL